MVAAVKTENKTLSDIARTCVLSLSLASEQVPKMSTIVLYYRYLELLFIKIS